MYLFIITIFLLIAAYLDFKNLKIPNWLSLVGVILAFILNLIGLNEMSLNKMLLNAAIVFIPLFSLWFVSTLFHFKAIGAGDIKLFTVLALFLPLEDTYLMFLLTIILSSVVALYRIGFKRFIEMFSDLGYMIFYGIPGKSDGKMKKVPLAPVLFIVFLFYLTPYYELFSSYWR